MPRLKQNRKIARLAVFSLMALLASRAALAGPPFATDDPEPVDYRHWEIYVFSEATYAEEDTEGVLPGFEFNYGLLPNVQLSITAPFAFNEVTGSETQSGYGDTEIGVKYRFVQEDKEGWLPQISFYPSVDLPTGKTDSDLDEGHQREFLPLWLQKSYGPWTTYGGGGYWINPGQENKNYWFFGWALLRKMTETLSLGGEIFHQTANEVEGASNSGFSLGGLYDLSENHHIVFSAGKGIGAGSDTNKFSYYIAYELTF